jgi:hypothetical protein
MKMRHVRTTLAAAVTMLVAMTGAQEARAQEHAGHGAAGDAPGHAMYQFGLGGGWRLLGMAQLFPMVTTGFGPDANDAVRITEFYANQPVVMFNVESPASRLVLRTTLNFEGVTLPDGEITFGAWGEGFIDRRHPHTLLHEAVLSLNLPDVAGGTLSFSAGRGFSPYGTDDPMARPAVKFPTNHHLSQVLERYFASTAFLRGPWSVEAGVFAGNEPTGPYDFSNTDGFPNSWSARVVHRPGGAGLMAPWEVSASFASVTERHHDEDVTTRLVNGYVRHDRDLPFGRLYTLVEGSVSSPAESGADGYFSVLGEAQLTRGAHQPYLRLEFATRPEYAREGVPGADGFFRYDHDSHAIGATRWFIATAGYGFEATRLPFSARPFAEIGYHNAVHERGNIAAQELYGGNHLFSLTAGVRLFFGGGPMRMGMYGVLDPMTHHGAMHTMDAPAGEHHDHHQGNGGQGW